MRIVFMGSPDFAVPTVRALLGSAHQVVAVVTQPDRPAGRGHASTAPPVKVFALEHGLTVLQPVNVSSPPAVERLRALEPDAIVVAAYGQILRERVLELPRRGSLNVHASLLPRHRGASPVTAAILAGDEVTGVTIMEVVRALDAGPIVAKVETEITAHDTAASLESRLSEMGARLLVNVIDDWAAGSLKSQAQDESLATYAPMVRRPDARIDWSLPAVDVWRCVRAFNPWPVAYTSYADEEIRVLEAWPLEGDSGAPAGTVIEPAALPEGAAKIHAAPSVQCGSGRLALITVQRPGKKAMSGLEFLRGRHDLAGSVLGSPS
jgi:methionyl-tRNA formyltransferase